MRVRRWMGLVVAVSVAIASSGFATEPVGQALIADDATVGLWRFDVDPTQGFEDRSGNGNTARLRQPYDKVTITPAPADLPDGLTHVASIDKGCIVLPGAMRGIDGPFTIEWRARLALNANGWLVDHHQTKALKVMLRDRDGGNWRIQYSLADDQGRPQEQITHTEGGILEAVGPWSTSRFHHVALTFDGDRTFTFLIDGHVAHRFTAPESAPLYVAGSDLYLGNRGRFYQSTFRQVAEVRISNIERRFEPRARRYPADLSQAIAQRAVRFDMTTTDSPLGEDHLRVDPDMTYSAETGYGWQTTPDDAFDSWFIGARAADKPDAVIAEGGRHVVAWQQRDGHDVGDGATFRVDLPPGRYEVVAHVGHPWKNRTVDKVVVNGTTIGQSLTTYPTGWRMYPVDRSARGVVDVKAEGLHVVFQGQGPMGVLAIDVYPFAKPPVTRNGTGLLVGPTSIDLTAVNEACARYDLKGAADLAMRISDPLIRSATLTWIAGHPTSVELWHERVIERILFDLDHLLVDQPENIPAASLRRSVQCLEDVVLGSQYLRTDRMAAGPAWRPWLEGVDQALQLQPVDPGYGQARFLAGSILYWMRRQGRKPVRDFPLPEPILEEARAAYPEARLPRIYLGEKLPVEKQIVIPKAAPQWAALSHRLLTRIVDEHDWWVNVKQDPETGLLGGGFGDDVEATRTWPVSILIADREDVREGWRRLYEYGWQQNPNVYRTTMMDIEHGSEDFNDAHMFAVFFEHGTPRHDMLLERTGKVWPLFRDVWTTVDDEGRRMFRSGKMSATQVSATPAGDSAYGLRCISAGLYQLYFARDPEARRLLLEYADHWRDAVLAERSGKPAGISPVWTQPDRTFGFKPGQWWTGLIGINYPVPIYYVYDCLLAAYDLTGDAKYLEPIWKGVELVRDHPLPEGTDPAALETGTLMWALYTPYVYRFWSGVYSIMSAAADARQLSGNTAYDDVLIAHGAAHTRTSLMLQRATSAVQRREALMPLIERLREDLDMMDYNVEMRTSEVRGTDRIEMRGIDTLLSMATGGRGNERANAIWPTFAVSWQDTGVDVSILLLEHTGTQLAGYLYSFAEASKSIRAKLWRLKPGRYQLRLVPVQDMTVPPDAQPLQEKEFELKERGQTITLTLPSRQAVMLRITPADP